MKDIKTTCKIALVQAEPVMFNKSASLKKTLQYISEAASQKPDLIVFPELFIPGYPFGMNFGFIQGVLKAYGIPYELVTPQKWKKEFSCTSDKNTSIEVCKRLFPDVNLKATDRCKKDHDGMAEALLLAEYGRRHYNGKS